MEKSEKIEIGKRLRLFAEKNFKSLAEFGRHFGKDRTFFTPYFNGSSIPGGDILKRLTELGCDLNWLITGELRAESLSKENEELLDEIKELKEINFVLMDQASKFSRVAEKIDREYSGLKQPEEKKKKSILDRWQLPEEFRDKKRKK